MKKDRALTYQREVPFPGDTNSSYQKPSKSQMPLPALDDARQLIQNAQRITIISHKNPDADAIGANLALREALETQWGKTVTSACVDAPPEDSLFLPGADAFVQTLNLAETDLLISVDCGGYKQLGFHEAQPEILDHARIPFLNIDHHGTNEHFGSVNIVLPDSSSTCCILFHLFTAWNLEITQSMATALLHGLYYDTGSFMHDNTDPDTLRVAGRLLARGGDHETPVKKLFKTSTLERLKLWGRAMERLEFNQKGGIVTALTETDFADTGSDFKDSSGLVNFLNCMSEGRYLMLLAEDGKGLVKGSLRTRRDDVNMAQIAQLMGGGGHDKAAGFAVKGTLEEKRVLGIKL